MRPIRLLRTTAFRLALAYAGGFSLLVIVALGFAYRSIAVHAEQQIDDSLLKEFKDLDRLFRSEGILALADELRRRSENSAWERLHYLLEPAEGGAAVGDIQRLSEATAGEIGAKPVLSNATVAVPVISAPRAAHHTGNTPIRILSARLSGGHRLHIAHELHAQEAVLAHAFGVISTTAAVTVMLALLGGAIMGLGVLRRIDAVSRTAGEIMAGDLSLRLPLGRRNNEFDDLARTLNRMLDRIEHLLASVREVTDNVAHDLRTPLESLAQPARDHPARVTLRG